MTETTGTTTDHRAPATDDQLEQEGDVAPLPSGGTAQRRDGGGGGLGTPGQRVPQPGDDDLAGQDPAADLHGRGVELVEEGLHAIPRLADAGPEPAPGGGVDASLERAVERLLDPCEEDLLTVRVGAAGGGHRRVQGDAPHPVGEGAGVLQADERAVRQAEVREPVLAQRRPEQVEVADEVGGAHVGEVVADGARARVGERLERGDERRLLLRRVRRRVEGLPGGEGGVVLAGDGVRGVDAARVVGDDRTIGRELPERGEALEQELARAPGTTREDDDGAPARAVVGPVLRRPVLSAGGREPVDGELARPLGGPFVVPRDSERRARHRRARRARLPAEHLLVQRRELGVDDGVRLPARRRAPADQRQCQRACRDGPSTGHRDLT